MAITLVGQAAASATTVTVPAHQAGDLLVIFAFNSTAATAPSLPTGWTNGANGAANTCGGRIGYLVATASGTTSGTWTNANRLVCVVYRGNGALSVGTAAGGNGTGTAVTLTALTLTSASNNKVVSFAGHRTATTYTDPSGLTRRGASATAPFVAAWDSDNAATYAAKTTTSNTSSGWRGSSLEIVEATPLAKAATLVTDFTADTGLFAGLTANNTISGGALRLLYRTTYDTVISAARYDLVGSQVAVQVTPSTAHANNETWLAFGDTGGVFDAPNTLQMIVSAGTLYLRERAASVSTDASVAYDATSMAWWRLREASGTVYWETAPTGSGPWTVRRSKAAAWTPSGHYIKFSAGNFTADQTSSMVVDNVNVVPSAAPPTGTAVGTATWTGAAVGSSRRRAAAAGTATWTGAAAGSSARRGAATGTATWTGTATGSSPRRGTAAGTATWTGQATGRTTRRAIATGTATWAGAAAGRRSPRATAAGVVTWTGSATGRAVKVAAAAGVATWTGSAFGTRAARAAAAGTWATTGEATGYSTRTAIGLGATTWTGDAIGAVASAATATGLTTWVGSAAGAAPVLLPPIHLPGTSTIAPHLGSAVLAGDGVGTAAPSVALGSATAAAAAGTAALRPHLGTAVASLLLATADLAEHLGTADLATT